MEKNEFRAVIKHLHMKGLTPKEIKAQIEAATPEIIDKVHDIVLTDQRVKVREVVEATGISHGTVISILHEQLDMKKLSARWVPRLLTVNHKRDCVTISKQCLEMFQRNPDEFLHRFVTVNETWIHYFTPETKEQSKQWTSPNELAPKKAKTFDYLPSKQTINGDYYVALLDCFNNILKKKRPHLAKKKVLFHQDNVWVHTCLAPMAKFNEFHYELLSHPAYSPDLAPCSKHVVVTDIEKRIFSLIMTTKSFVKNNPHILFTKVNKVGYLLRIIVSSVRSPLYNVASFLNDILHDSILVANSFIKNSFHLTKHISNLTISDNEVLLFFDMILLFTNVLIDLVLEGIERRWHLIEKKTNIPKRKFFKALELTGESYTFNSFHSRLKFTTEIDEDKLDFLDVSLIRKGNSLIQNWYYKPIVLSLSHSIYHQKNFELIIKILLNNGYPLKLIFFEIKNRLLTKFNARIIHLRIRQRTIMKINHKFFTIPFIPFLSEKIKKCFKKDSLSVIREDRISHQHNFDWGNVKILNEEKVLNKRLISKVIHIKQQKQSLNLQNATYSLDYT
ncbi:SETMR methyltransferase, partial [Acromyrmex charruanus]